MINKSTKIMLLSGPAIFGFTMSATTPTVQLHFYKLVDESVYALAGVLYTSIAALSQSIMAKEQYRSKIRKLFGYILILDVLAFLGISIAGMEHVTLRFIGISVLSATTISLWMTIINATVNNVLSSEKLTDFESLSKACCLWANLAGGILAIMLTNIINIEVAIYLQCMGNFICAVTDYTAYRKLN